MMLPDNGKVVIVDDKIEDVIELISGLSSEKIPFVYYKDELGDDLPEEPLNNVRILFLDLLLIDDNKPPTKTVISTLVSRIKRIISPENGPYILIYFSSTRKTYGKAFEKELNKRSLKKYKPLLSLSISKPTDLEKVKRELHERFDKFKSFKAFLLLESIVNRAISSSVNNIAEIIPKTDEHWDKKLKDILYQTGEARTGEVTFSALTNGQKIKNSLLTLSSTFDKNFEIAINEIDFDEITFDPVAKKDTSEEARARVNSKLHIFRNSSSNIKCGTVYHAPNNKQVQKAITETFLEKHTIEEKTPVKLVFIDLTPVCDYSQEKNYSRGVFALLIENSKYKIKGKIQSFFTESPMFYIDKKVQVLIIDYRSFTSYSKNVFEQLKIKPLFKLSSQYTTELQASVSKHINRPGIINL
jgi:hypothetical protein